MQSYVVVWDPENVFWEGAIVDAVRVKELEGRGVVVLPCIPDLFSLAGYAGFAKRSWGAGWSLDMIAPRPVCPFSIFVPFDSPRVVSWCARLVPGPEARDRLEKGRPAADGLIRLSAGETRGNVFSPVLTDERDPGTAFRITEFSKLGKPDERGGWTIYGRSRLHAAQEGCYGLALWGKAPGLRVAWVAASLST